MGRIIFETKEINYELEKSDVEILKHFQTITGIRVVFKSNNKDLANTSISETSKAFDAGESKPFDDENMPDKGDIGKYLMDHLDGFKIPMVLEHFYNRVPRYGVSEEQTRLLGKFTARIKRAREAIEQSEDGQFVTETKGSDEYFVFKKNIPTNVEITNFVSDDKESVETENAPRIDDEETINI